MSVDSTVAATRDKTVYAQIERVEVANPVPDPRPDCFTLDVYGQ